MILIEIKLLVNPGEAAWPTGFPPSRSHRLAFFSPRQSAKSAAKIYKKASRENPPTGFGGG